MGTLAKFEKPDFTKNTTWSDVFGVYDRNFERLYYYLKTLGTNYNVEYFTNVTSNVITLENDFTPGRNQLLVFIDGVIQWLGVDYRETGENQITFDTEISEDEEIRVIIVKSYDTYADVEELTEAIRKVYSDSQALAESAHNDYINLVDLHERVSHQLTSTESELLDLQRMLDNISKLSASATKSESYVRAYRDEINALVNLLEGESADSQLAEVVAARGAHPSLGERLNNYAYYYNTVSDVKIADIETGAQCVVFGEEVVGDTQTKVYKIVATQQDIEEGVEDYFELDDHRWAELVTIFSGVGGSGGGVGVATVTLEALDSTNRTIALGSVCNLSYHFETTVGTSASVKYYVNDILKYSGAIVEGDQQFNIGPYLSGESSVVEVIVTDRAGGVGTLTYVINSITLSIKTTFDDMSAYSSAIVYRYTAVGEVTKTIHFELDGTALESEIVVASGTQMGRVIQSPGHGAHRLRVWATATIDGNTLISNVLEHLVVCYEPGNLTPIIASLFESGSSFDEGDTVVIPYRIYKVGSVTVDATLVANETTVGSIVNMDRSMQYWTVNRLNIGENTLEIRCENVRKSFTVNVVQAEIDLSAVSAGLMLHLSADGKTNNSSDWDSWNYGNIVATLTGFNRGTDGWRVNENNEPMLRLIGTARVNIPVTPFSVDARANGLTVEIEFETRQAASRSTTLIECMANNVGFRVTPQTALFSTEQLSEASGSAVKTKFKENSRIRVSFVVQPRSEHRLVEIYVNGVASAAKQYQLSDNFYQNSPQGITIGSDEANIDIYNIRIYNTALSMLQILQNYWADRPTLAERLAVYRRNNILNSDGSASYAKVSQVMPCMTIIGELPPSKGEKRTVSVTFKNPLDPTKDFTYDNCTIDVQGTSSQYYPRKNWKIKGIKNYKLRDDSIEESTFCMKANYMDSSSARNTCLAVLINDILKKICPTPKQLANPNIRTTIDGYVIAMFYKSDVSAEPVCHGIYCFNNDKSDVSTFGFEEGNESWEFKNNTSDLCLFNTDSDDGIEDCFEGRYPEDSTDFTNLLPVVQWVYSTKNNPTKFKQEAENYFNIDALLSYYLICLVFGMSDSLGKNMFLTYYPDDGENGLWRPIFYDMDTCFGLNNEGVNIFTPDMELTDEVVGAVNTYCFNAHGSVLWANVEAAYQTELVAMYKRLRENGLDIENLTQQFWNKHISMIPEALYNIDSDYKYIGPIRESNDATYLYCLQGSGYDYWEWWIGRSLFYNDSRFDYYTIAMDYLTLRAYNQGAVDVEVYCYDSMYLKYKFGSVVDKKRVRVDAQDHCTASATQTYTDTETIFYGASNIVKIDNLAALKPGTLSISMAQRLSEVYPSTNLIVNPNLYEITAGNNDILRTVWAAYAANLRGILDLSRCNNLRVVRVDNTNITAVELPDGGSLTELYLPGSLTSLKVKNQPNLRTISGTWSSLTSVTIEGISGFDVSSILGNASNLARLRLLDVYISADDLTFLDTLWDKAGIDENGDVVEHAVVTGTFYARGASLSMLAEYQATYASRFPELEITAKAPVFYPVHFRDWDGTEIDIQQVEYGENAVDPTTRATNPVAVPTRPADDVYSEYTFNGWDGTMTGVTSERWIITKWTGTKKRYTVSLYNNNVLINDYNVDYNGTVSFYDDSFAYQGATQEGDNWQFWKWSKPIEYVRSSRECHAIWVNVQDSFVDRNGNTITRLNNGTVKQLADFSWAEIKEIGVAGLAKFWFSIGDEKDIVLSDSEVITMRIEDFDHDYTDATCEDVHPYSFGMKHLMRASHRMNPSTGTNGDDSTVGGWRDSEMLQYLENTVFPKLPASLQNMIGTTCKISCEGGLSYELQKVTSHLWLRTPNEVGANQSTEPTVFAGKQYPIYTNNASRIKYYSNGSLSAGYWWLSLPYRSSPRNFWGVYTSGGVYGGGAWGSFGVSFGFGF